MAFSGRTGGKGVKDLLCPMDSKEPVLVFLVGEVLAAYFFNSKCMPKTPVSIHVELVMANCKCTVRELMWTLTISAEGMFGFEWTPA